MSFKLNNNAPLGPNVCGTNLRPEFFHKAGIQSLPEGLEIHVGYKHGEPAAYHISKNGADVQTVDHSSVAPTLIARGATPIPICTGC